MKRALLLTAALLASAPALAQDFPPAPPISDPKPFHLPATETYTLPNGMAVTLVSYGVAPNAVVSLRVRAGNATEGETTWLADLTGAMMKEGAAGRTAGQLSTAAASMGGDLNVGVGQQTTAVTMNVLSEYASDAVRLISQVAIRPDLPAGELARVKANLGRQLTQALAQPGTLADIALARAANRYGIPFTVSTAASVRLEAIATPQVAEWKAAFVASIRCER